MAKIYDLSAKRYDDWSHSELIKGVGGDQRLFSLERILAEGATLASSSERIGVRLPPDAPVDQLAEYLPLIDLIELEFPNFADGRAFTQARELRERFDFKGDIRAVGEVFRDQLAFMVRVGFNQFDLSREHDFSVNETLAEIRYSYQAG